MVDKDITADKELMKGWLARIPDTPTITGFQSGPGIDKLHLHFNIEALRAALKAVLEAHNFLGDIEAGFGAIALTRMPGRSDISANDLSGRYWLRPDTDMQEVAREEFVDEAAFTELVPEFKDTYFETVHTALSARFPIGRMRILSKGIYNCNSWHRDPEPRLHIPIITNPGSLFVVNHHVTHLPADGSVYFTDTRGYHTALNGGESTRVHIVAALPDGFRSI